MLDRRAEEHPTSQEDEGHHISLHHIIQKSTEISPLLIEGKRKKKHTTRVDEHWSLFNFICYFLRVLICLFCVFVC